MTEGPRRRGRPSAYAESPTAWGRWLDARRIGIEPFQVKLQEAAVRLGYPPGVVPSYWHLTNLRNARRTPTPLTILIIQEATGGEVTLRDWVPTPDEVLELAADLLIG